MLTTNYNHPYALRAQKIAVSIPMVPRVSGEVVEITSKTNVSMKKGELLLHIDSTRYHAQLNKLEADLAAGEAMLRAKQATIGGASARVQRAQVGYDRVTRDYRRYTQGAAMPVNPSSEQGMTHAGQQVQIQMAVLQVAKAQLQNAGEQVSGRYNGLDANIASLKSQILEARCSLARTTIRASNGGYIIQLLARPGMTAVRLPSKPVLTFIPQQKRQVVAVFRQNSVLRLTTGDSAEVVFNGLPGSVYSSEVSRVLPAIPDGSYQASGALQGLSAGAGKESIYVLTDLDPHPEVEHLPDRVSVQAVVYTGYFTHVSVMHKVLLRMTSWLHCLYLDH